MLTYSSARSSEGGESALVDAKLLLSAATSATLGVGTSAASAASGGTLSPGASATSAAATTATIALGALDVVVVLLALEGEEVG